MVGQRVKQIEWVHGGQCVVRVEVEGIRPADDEAEVYFEPATVRHLEELQRLADAGDTAELAKHGTVFVRQSV